MKFTYFAVKKELARNAMALQKLDGHDYYLTVDFITNTTKAMRNHKYKHLFAAIINREAIIDNKLESKIPEFESYCNRIEETKEKMEISKQEEADILACYGSKEERKKCDIDTLDYYDSLFQNEIRKRDKVYKKMKRKGYY